MKLNVIALLLSIFMFTACSDSAADKLRESVKQANETCPIRIASGISIISIDYDDNTVTYNVASKTPLLSVAVLKSQEAVIKPALLEAMKSSDDPKVQEELALVREAKADFRVVISDDSGSMEMVFPPEEL